MFYNVSQLLMEPTGATRRFQLDQPLSDRMEGFTAGQATGDVWLLRTHQGLLVNATVDVEVNASCDRCLTEFSRISALDIEEECYPMIDPGSGRRVFPPDLSEGVLHIDINQMLDLSDVLRQYLLTCEPLKSLCRENCRGLCHDCGADLNEEKCKCDDPAIDPRWGALADLLPGESR